MLNAACATAGLVVRIGPGIQKSQYGAFEVQLTAYPVGVSSPPFGLITTLSTRMLSALYPRKLTPWMPPSRRRE